MTNNPTTIAILTDTYADYQKALVDRISIECNRRGYGALCITGRELESYLPVEQSGVLGGRLYSLLQGNVLSGLISLTGTIENGVDPVELEDFIGQFEVPKVSIGLELPGMPNVLVDDRMGMEDLVRHLIVSTKAKNIAFVQGFENDPYSDQREDIYRRVLAEAGCRVSESFVVRGNYDTYETYRVVSDLLRSDGDQIDAIVAANDAMALSAARAITSLGYDIPGDIAVTGFDDTGEASRHSPALTTVRQPLTAMAFQSVDLLVSQLMAPGKAKCESQVRVVKSELIIRGSTILGREGPEGDCRDSHSIDDLYDQIMFSMSGLPVPDNVNLRSLTDCLWKTLGDGGEHLSCMLKKSLLNDVTPATQHWWSNLCHQMESYSARMLLSTPKKRFIPVVVAALSVVKERIWAISMEREFDINQLRNAHAIMHLQMSSCTTQEDILATTTTWLECINPQRWFLVWYKSPLEKPDVEAKLTQVYGKGNSVSSCGECFESRQVLPDYLLSEFNEGLMALSPIHAGGLHFGYLLIDPIGVKSVDIASVSVSISNAMRGLYLTSKLNQKTDDLENANIELNQLAKYDGLTGLPNRWHFHQTLEQEFARSIDEDKSLALLFIDLDGFKAVNDNMGHDAGDKLLFIISKRLQRGMDTVNGYSFVARLGGDEFTMIVTVDRQSSQQVLAELSLTLLRLVAQPCKINGQSVVVSASIGYSIKSAEVQDTESLLGQADRAMYKAKATGRNCFIAYSPSIENINNHRMHLVQKLRNGLMNGDLQVHYQPRVDLSTGQICGAEALMRWSEIGEDGPVVVASPDDFIPAAERAGLIKELDFTALEQCLSQILRWRQYGIDIVISVNVSVVCLQQESFVSDVLKRIEHYQVKPSSIELEITESAAMGDVEANFTKLSMLKEAGVQLSIDDFGTGYSSLSYLKKFPVDNLKIDRSFIMEITEENGEIVAETAVVRAIVALGKSMRIGLVAEGIETRYQHEFVKKLGCIEGQGFYFSKPVSADEITDMLLQDVGSLKWAA